MSAVEQPARRLPAPRRAVVVGYDLADSPLWVCADRHSLWGRVVTDPREVAQIRARVERGRRRRWFR